MEAWTREREGMARKSMVSELPTVLEERCTTARFLLELVVTHTTKDRDNSKVNKGFWMSYCGYQIK